GRMHAETGHSHAETPRPRLPHRAADHGAARSARAALDVADPVGAARGRADLTRAPHRLRRGFADGAEPAPERIARDRLRRARRWRRLRPYAARPRAQCNVAAAVSLRGALEPALGVYAAATVRLAPSACTTFTRLPAGASGPATRQIVSSIRTVPVPST